MIDFSVSWVPWLVVAVANFVLSWLYYSPAAPWFKAWAVGVGMDLNKTEMTDEDKRGLPLLFGGAILSSLLMPYMMQVVVHSVRATDFVTGALVGLVIWAGFALTHSLNTLFEGRKPGVLVINHGLFLLTYAGFGGLFAIWK